MVYVQSRHIGESRILISDRIEIVNVRDEWFFNASLEHIFLISVLRKCGFGLNLISWIEILLKNRK